MALTIIATPKATDANSYATVAEADAYNEAHVSGATWTSAAAETKKAALIMATRLLDTYYDWVGYRTEEDQALRWPRAPLFNEDGIAIDEDTIPQFLVNAVSELARNLITQDLTADPDTKGFKRITLGPITLEVDKYDAERIVMSDAVSAFVRYYGRVVVRSSNVSLFRV